MKRRTRMSGRRGIAMVLAFIGLFLLFDAAMFLVDVLPQRPSTRNEHWRSEWLITFALVLVSGILTAACSSIVWPRSRRTPR